MVKRGEYIELGVGLDKNKKKDDEFSTNVEMIIELCLKVEELEKRIKKLEEA